MDAICLDMDGTLVDSERLWDIAVYELAEQMGRPLDAETRARTMGVAIDGFFDILGEYTGRPVGGEDRVRLEAGLNARMRDLMSTELEWRPGARELLDELAVGDVPLALVTNTATSVAAEPIDFIGRDRFDVIVTGDQVARPKPAPDPYLLACERLGVAPGATVVIEDSVTGGTSAVAAGCRVLLVPSQADQAIPAGVHVHDTLVGVIAEDLDRLTAGTPSGGAVRQFAP